jgi:hypothetical protein
MPGPYLQEASVASTKVFDEAAEAHQRDPRKYPYGYLTGGSEEFDAVRVFVWFRSIDELIECLLEVEPRMYGVEPKRGLEAYQERVRPILERVRQQGLDEALRAELAPESDGKFVVDWWGTYADLRGGRGEFGCQVIDGYLGEERRGQLLPAGEDTAFINYLRPSAE